MKIFVLMQVLFAAGLVSAAAGHDALKGREWILHRPEGAAKAAVVLLYGYGGRAEGYCPKFVAAARRRGLAVCVPEAMADGKGKRSWNVGYPSQAEMAVDDTTFLSALTKRLRADLGVRRVFLVGMSNGGEMCYQMAALAPKAFDAIASVAGLTLACLADKGPPAGGVPFLEIHGDADTTSRWDGDTTNANGYWGAYLSVTGAVARLVAANGGDWTRFATQPPTNGVVRQVWPGRHETRLCRVKGGRHSWLFDRLDTAGEILDFFEAASRDARL